MCAPSSNSRSSWRSLIQTTDPEIARRPRSRTHHQPDVLRPIMPRLGPGLHGDAPPPAGSRAAQPRLGDGTRLDDRVGYRFALLATPDLLDALDGPLSARIESLNVARVPCRRRSRGLSRDPGVEAVVIRPDRYILGVASTPRELAAVLERMPHQRRACRKFARAGHRDLAEEWTMPHVHASAGRTSIDHVGSLSRPPELVQSWRDWEAGKLAFRRLARGAGSRHPRRGQRCRKPSACPSSPTASFAGAAGRAAFSARSKASTSAPRLTFRNDEGFSTASPPRSRPSACGARSRS